MTQSLCYGRQSELTSAATQCFFQYPEYWEILSGIPLRLHYVVAYHGQVHSAFRGVLNVVAKAWRQEGVHAVSYSADI
jgi:hypothetical protein